MVRCPKKHDLVALFHELRQLAMLLYDPRAGAINHFKATIICALEHFWGHPVRTNDDCCAFGDLVERLHALNATGMKVRDQSLVVHDVPERVRCLPLGARNLRLVDRLAHAIADPCALRDADALDTAHVGDYPLLHPSKRTCHLKGARPRVVLLRYGRYSCGRRVATAARICSATSERAGRSPAEYVNRRGSPITM